MTAVAAEASDCDGADAEASPPRGPDPRPAWLLRGVDGEIKEVTLVKRR